MNFGSPPGYFNPCRGDPVVRLLTLSLTAALAASLTVSPSLAAQKSVGGSSERVTVRSQPGAPLRISAVADNSDDPEAPLVSFLVENVTGKPIQAYWISYDTVAHGGDVTLGVGVNAGTSEQVLPPGRRREAGVLNRGGQRLKLWVDFVEFTDGTTWGEDASRYAESLAGQRAGARGIRAPPQAAGDRRPAGRDGRRRQERNSRRRRGPVARRTELPLWRPWRAVAGPSGSPERRVTRGRVRAAAALRLVGALAPALKSSDPNSSLRGEGRPRAS